MPPSGIILPVFLSFSAPSIGTSCPEPVGSGIDVPTSIGRSCPVLANSYIPAIQRHCYIGFLIVLGFNDTSTLVGHFVLSPREREKRDSTGNEREGQGRKRNRNESEETEEIEIFPLYPYLLQG